MGQDYYWETANPSGGVNNRLPDTQIADNELSDCANYQPDMTGQGWLTKREGLTKSSDNKTGTTYSVYDGRNGDYFHNGTVVYNFAGTSLATGLASAYDSWASYQAYDLFVNGTDAQLSSNGSSFSAITGVAADFPSGVKYLASSNNFCYAAGHDKGALRYCDYGDLTSWPSINQVVFSQDQGDDIIGLMPVTNALGVWCTKSFYFLTGYSNIDQQIGYYNKSDGCLAHRSIVNTPHGIFWWSRAGIAWLKEGYVLDYPMQRKLTDTLANMNRAYDAYVHACWDDNEGRVMFWVFNGTSQTTVNLRVDFYPQTDAFFLHSGVGTQMSASGPSIVSGVRNIYVGGYASSTYLYKQSGLTDDGTAITAYLATKREGSPTVFRDGRTVVISTDLTGSETITYKVYVDNATTAETRYSAAIAANPQDTVVSLNRQNTRLKHYITDAATTTRSRIIGISHTGHITRVI